MVLGQLVFSCDRGFTYNDTRPIVNPHWLILYNASCLTPWGRVTHMCLSKQTSIGSDNGLSPGRCKAIIGTNAGILLIGPLGTNLSEISNEIHILSFRKMHLKMSSGKWRPFCLGLNELILWSPRKIVDYGWRLTVNVVFCPPPPVSSDYNDWLQIEGQNLYYQDFCISTIFLINAEHRKWHVFQHKEVYQKTLFLCCFMKMVSHHCG